MDDRRASSRELEDRDNRERTAYLEELEARDQAALAAADRLAEAVANERAALDEVMETDRMAGSPAWADAQFGYDTAFAFTNAALTDYRRLRGQ